MKLVVLVSIFRCLPILEPFSCRPVKLSFLTIYFLPLLAILVPRSPKPNCLSVLYSFLPCLCPFSYHSVMSPSSFPSFQFTSLSFCPLVPFSHKPIWLIVIKIASAIFFSITIPSEKPNHFFYRS